MGLHRVRLPGFKFWVYNVLFLVTVEWLTFPDFGFLTSSAPRRDSAEPRPRGCSGLGEPRPALPSF